MPFSVKKSFLRNNPLFESAVAAHAKELKDWIEREKRVAEDMKNPNTTDADRWVSCPKPESPNEWVASSVDENGNVSFDVVDDDPTPEEILGAKKTALINELQSAEDSAHNEVFPINKRPFLGIQVADIGKADQALRARMIAAASEKFTADFDAYNGEVERISSSKRGILASAAAKIGISEDPRISEIQALEKPKLVELNIEDDLAKLRTDDENRVLAENQRIQAEDENISRNAARSLHEIEDLTVETIDQYRIPDLKRQG